MRPRQHEIDRILRERDEQDAQERKKFWENVVIIKVAVMVGLGLSMFLPAEHKDYAIYAANVLWLWRT